MGKVKVILVALGASLLLTACGGSKTANNSQWGAIPKVKQEVDECIIYQMQKPGTRAYGYGVSNNLSRAVSYAEAQARGQFARKLESIITSAQEQYSDGYGMGHSDGRNGSNVRDEGEISNDLILQIAQGTVKNMTIVKTSQYMQADGAYQMYVCLEYNGDIAKLADDITKKMKQQVSDDERMKMKYDFEKFRERVAQELEKSAAQ